MVVCDAIWTDPGTNKHTLLGTFTEITAQEFPVMHRHLAVYVEATGGRGKMPIVIRGVDADENHEVFKIEAEATANDPRSVLQLSFNIPVVEFPEAGEYRIQFYANGEFMVERRILLKPVEK
ncbi:MAG: hypothetical protein DWQ29_21325 [Planctomycetota bacterium]|nr:MAG: hypothetical protein DWQ29_21325 [Planctomycetota bacterium]